MFVRDSKASAAVGLWTRCGSVETGYHATGQSERVGRVAPTLAQLLGLGGALVVATCAA